MEFVQSQLVFECSRAAVLIRIKGPDSLGLRVVGRPFHKIQGGITTLSASGLIIDRRNGYVLTSATLLAPFLLQEDSSMLRKGTAISVMTNGFAGIKAEEDEEGSFWVNAKVIRILKSTLVHGVMKKFRTDPNWVVGWNRDSDPSLAHLGQIDMNRKESIASSYWNGYEDLALLQIHQPEQDSALTNSLSVVGNRILGMHLSRDHQRLALCDLSSIRRGTKLFLVASPYGILSPSVFHNCVYPMFVSNTLELSIQKYAHLLSSTASTSSVQSSSTSFLTSSSPPSSSQPSPSTSTSHKIISSIQDRTSRFKKAFSSPSSAMPPSVPPSHPNPIVIMIDQPGLPGCEGGPVFDSNGNLVGLLAPPLRRKDGSNVEVHLVLPLHPFLQQLEPQTRILMPSDKAVAAKLDPRNALIASSSTSADILTSPTLQPHARNLEDTIHDILPSIVVVSIGTFWGSGIVIDPKGYILTAGHVLKPFLANTSATSPKLQEGHHIDIRIDSYKPVSSSADETSQVHFADHVWLRANLVFISLTYFDVALLKICNPPSNLHYLPIIRQKETNDPVEGKSIFVLGYALFGPSKKVKATCTNGLISRVSNLYGRPKLIQTSASVNKGASGGAVIDTFGCFVGLVTSNAMTKRGSIIPKINFSIPACMLEPIHEFVNPTASETAGVDSLEYLAKADPQTESLWKISVFSDDESDIQSIFQGRKESSPETSSERGKELRKFWNQNTQLLAKL